MNKKSIYVSIACLGFDSELKKTISTCINNSSKNNNIIISIACIGNEYFYNDIKQTFIKQNNIYINFYNFKDNYGVGKGRNLSAKLYNNEDYFLQIDSHTLFDLNWDDILIETFEESLKFSNNKKTILSTCPSRYEYVIKDNSIVIGTVNEELPYTYWIDNGKKNNIPKWGDESIDRIYPNIIEKIKKQKFIPNVKLSAAFIFGNSEFARNRFLSNDILFWEEEIIQSVELLYNNFSIIYPYIKSPFYHLYSNKAEINIGYRDNIDDMIIDNNIDISSFYKQMVKNYDDYVLNPNNHKKVLKFIEYSGMDIKTGTLIKTPSWIDNFM